MMFIKLTKLDDRCLWVSPREVAFVEETTDCAGSWGFGGPQGPTVACTAVGLKEDVQFFVKDSVESVLAAVRGAL